jgi:flagellar biosynthesis protein FliQ
MNVDQVVLLGRMMLQEVLILVGPVLAVAIAVSLTVNVIQVLTSLQDTTISTVTRLLVTGAALFFMMPWMWRHLAHYTLVTFTDFRGYLQ